MPEDNQLEPVEPFPEAQLRDLARSGLDAGIAAVPVVGGAIEVFLDVLVPTSLEKRRNVWFTKIGEAVRELQNRNEAFTVESLASNELFMSVLLETSRIAIRTHREEKLENLKSVLVNTAADPSRGDFITLQLLRFVDELEQEHLTILRYFSDPGLWFDEREITRPNYTFASTQQLMNDARLPIAGNVLQIVLKDLNDRALVNTGSMTTTVSGPSIWRASTTDLGMALLNFVRSS